MPDPTFVTAIHYDEGADSFTVRLTLNTTAVDLQEAFTVPNLSAHDAIVSTRSPEGVAFARRHPGRWCRQVIQWRSGAADDSKHPEAA